MAERDIFWRVWLYFWGIGGSSGGLELMWKPRNSCIVCKQFKQNKFQFHFVIIRIKFLFSLYLGSHSFISLLSRDLQFCTLLDLGFQGRRGKMKNFTKWNTHYTFRIIIDRNFSRMNLTLSIKLLIYILFWAIFKIIVIT